MQYSTNYNLKKPDYTDFADIQDINDNMDTIDEQLAAPTGDSADSTTTFTCSDVADGSASSWTTVPALTSGETHKSLFAKMSQMFKNIRYLYKMLGTTDISSIGNGTVTNALSVLNANKLSVSEIQSSETTWTGDVLPQHAARALQHITTDIANYNNGVYSVTSDGGPYYGVVMFKYSNTLYSGFLFSYGTNMAFYRFSVTNGTRTAMLIFRI